MKTGYFITGTDTDSGKTWVTVALMRKLRQQGFTVAGMKPVAAGCEWREGQFKNPDALLIQENATLTLAYEQINPYAFELPISPHIACGDADVNFQHILSVFATLKRNADAMLVEGAGGWLSPLSRAFDNANLAEAMGLPVILAVGMRLGCINHARLTFQAIKSAGVDCAGWVAVEVVPEMHGFQANLEYLKHCLDAPLLGVLPHKPGADFDFFAGQLIL